MRVFVTGVKGQLGYDVMNELEKQGLEGIGVDIDEMDITDADQVNEVIKEAAPDAVIHCAAYTAVDAAEDNEEICRKVNAQGTENIAKVCEELDIKMMYISTDYVFNGQGERPWGPDDKREPLNVYGQTKYEGELAIEYHIKSCFFHVVLVICFYEISSFIFKYCWFNNIKSFNIARCYCNFSHNRSPFYFNIQSLLNICLMHPAMLVMV